MNTLESTNRIYTNKDHRSKEKELINEINNLCCASNLDFKHGTPIENNYFIFIQFAQDKTSNITYYQLNLVIKGLFKALEISYPNIKYKRFIQQSFAYYIITEY